MILHVEFVVLLCVWITNVYRDLPWSYRDYLPWFFTVTEFCLPWFFTVTDLELIKLNVFYMLFTVTLTVIIYRDDLPWFTVILPWLKNYIFSFVCDTPLSIQFISIQLNSIQFNSILFCSVLFYSILVWSGLVCSSLIYSSLFYPILSYPVLPCVLLYSYLL